MNRVINYIFLIVLIAAIAGFYFYFKQNEIKQTNPLDFVDAETELLVKIDNPLELLNRLTSENLFFSDYYLSPDTANWLKFTYEKLSLVDLEGSSLYLGFKNDAAQWYALLYPLAKPLNLIAFGVESAENFQFILLERDTLYVQQVGNLGIITNINQFTSIPKMANTSQLSDIFKTNTGFGQIKMAYKGHTLIELQENPLQSDTSWTEINWNLKADLIQTSSNYAGAKAKSQRKHTLLEAVPSAASVIFSSNTTNTSNKQDELFTYWMGNEVLLALFNEMPSTNAIALVECNNKTAALQALDSLIAKDATADYDSLYSRNTIYTLKNNEAFKLKLGEPFAQYEYAFISFFEDYIILATHKINLEIWLTKLNENDLLIHTPAFKPLYQNFFTEAYYLIAGNRATAEKNLFLRELIKNDLIQKVFPSKNDNHLVSVQVSSANNITFSNFQLQYKGENLSNVDYNTVWKQEFRPLYPKLFWVKNHITQLPELVFQDSTNNIYLLSANGKELWNAPIDGQINTDIKQIDAYKNNKLQLLFATENSLYLVDRIGRTVGNFPVAKKDKAAHHFTLTDYDNNKDYRILQPENNAIKNIDALGNNTKGWKSNGVAQKLSEPIQYFRQNQKDYLMVIDEQGMVSILNRRGELRENSKTKVNKDRKTPVLLQINNQLQQNTLTYVSGQDLLVRVNLLDGKAETLKPFNANTQYKWISQGASSNLATINQKELNLYTADGDLWLNLPIANREGSLDIKKIATTENNFVLLIQDANSIKILDGYGSLLSIIESAGGRAINAVFDKESNELLVAQIKENKVYLFKKSLPTYK
ncbi:MAG: hypothetical protein ACXITV_01675 [Luteibaculaceae bacterium]